MKKLIYIFILLLSVTLLVGCQEKTDDSNETIIVDNTYRLLMEAEDLSGMTEKTQAIITQAGSLGLPTSYQGVTITYRSRNEEIISNSGVVTLPTTCWIESRDQQGDEVFENLNDNWPVVVDVTLSLNGQTRTAKLLFVVAPAIGFTCNKYLG